MHDISDLVVFDNTAILVFIADIEWFVPAREVEFLLAHICHNHILIAKLFCESRGKRHSDLSLTASEQDAGVLEWSRHFRAKGAKRSLLVPKYSLREH